MLRRLFGRKAPDIESMDGQVIAQLRKAGADLSKPRDTVHYLYFQTEDGADIAAEQLRTHGLTAVVQPAAAGSDPWLVKANHDYVVSAESIREIRRVAEEAAKAGGGEYDGWEAAAAP
jgi:hypothetical protein